MTDQPVGWTVTTSKRIALPLGVALVTLGVLLHFPDFLSAYRASMSEAGPMSPMTTTAHGVVMTGMGMSPAMVLGMVLIAVGFVAGGWGVTPHLRSLGHASRSLAGARFESVGNGRLSRRHWALVSILTIGLVVDTMKPATLGFVLPGMSAEYGLTTQQTAWLPFTAIAGTVLGSLIWGYLADIVGRRATLLFSGVIYMGTSICGFMPEFRWNLIMCLLMGASAGGMLPTVYSLTAESIPARGRGPLIVIQSGLGATFGYLVASGAATLLVPLFGWRVLWLLGLPSGLTLLALCRWIPESPRFLLATGQDEAAIQVMRTYGIRLVSAAAHGARITALAAPKARQGSRFSDLFAEPYLRRSMSVVLYGLGWGVVNWGFITFLPTFLQQVVGGNTERLLFTASLAAVPSVFVAAYFYGRWSSRGSMVVYSVLTIAALLCFAALGVWHVHQGWLTVALVGLLLSTTAGMIAMLSPYCTEQYPTSLRATGSGVAAAASKIGGMAGPLLLSVTPVLGVMAVISAAPLVLATVVLMATGTETAGQQLPEHHHVDDGVMAAIDAAQP